MTSMLFVVVLVIRSIYGRFLMASSKHASGSRCRACSSECVLLADASPGHWQRRVTSSLHLFCRLQHAPIVEGRRLQVRACAVGSCLQSFAEH
jgi:hypothetical protein